MTPDPDAGGANPFADPPDSRDPIRRFRGRIAGGVSIVTAGTDRDRAGLTVSSLMVAEGEPGLVYLLVGSTSDLFGQLELTGRFVVHICSGNQRDLAEVFAGLRPSPGGTFAGRAVSQSKYGDILDDIGTRAYCSVMAMREESYSVLVSGAIDRVEAAGDSRDPLLFHRGGYGRLA